MLWRFLTSAILLLALAVSFLPAQPPRRGDADGPRGPGEGRQQAGFRPPPLPFIDALDADRNRQLSREEIANAVAALTALDKNRDGTLTSDETGWPPEFLRDARRSGFPTPPPPPPLDVIDADHDNTISAAELAKAVAALQKLDKNKDGALTDAEMRPDFGGFPGGLGGFPDGPGGFPGGPGGFPLGGEVSGERLAPEQVKPRDGAAAIPNHAAFQKLSYKGEEVMIDTFLAGLEFVKFTIDGAETAQPQFYFINTNTHRAHMMFARAVGLPARGADQMKGVLVYRPMLKAPDGRPGLFTFEFEPFDTYPFEMVMVARELLVEKMPILKGRLGYYPRQRGLTSYERDKADYDASDLPVYLDQDLSSADFGYLPLHAGVSFGTLRVMGPTERPGPRDIVLYKSLPNELSRVAGVITEVRQTPLSHVNLRAVQDGIPNAFITRAAEHEGVKPWIGKPVRYQVTADGFEIREATAAEVEAHFAGLRPAHPQIPGRDLSVLKIRPLDEIGFDNSSSVGVKAANVAAMRSFGFPDGTIPDGFAIPFSFYDEFMRHNDFYEYVAALLNNPEFKSSRDTQEAELKKLRGLIKKGKLPPRMSKALEALHASFPAGVSLRCRSSTNNEDLPGFSGAGLYDSYTHKADEGPLSKSILQVYASMWNFRAFEEREFYRVDHKAAAMGVLVHRNYKGELANGVAVTDDILYQTLGNYYVNTQVGENLVTNPSVEAAPEELLLAWWEDEGDQLIQSSNQLPDGKRILSDQQRGQLRKHLARIHGRFSKLYGRSADDASFAMEIEFKITDRGAIVIKQARPWVNSSE